MILFIAIGALAISVAIPIAIKLCICMNTKGIYHRKNKISEFETTYTPYTFLEILGLIFCWWCLCCRTRLRKENRFENKDISEEVRFKSKIQLNLQSENWDEENTPGEYNSRMDLDASNIKIYLKASNTKLNISKGKHEFHRVIYWVHVTIFTSH